MSQWLKLFMGVVNFRSTSHKESHLFLSPSQEETSLLPVFLSDLVPFADPLLRSTVGVRNK